MDQPLGAVAATGVGVPLVGRDCFRAKVWHRTCSKVTGPSAFVAHRMGGGSLTGTASPLGPHRLGKFHVAAVLCPKPRRAEWRFLRADVLSGHASPCHPSVHQCGAPVLFIHSPSYVSM